MKSIYKVGAVIALGSLINACSSGGGSGSTTVNNSLTSTYKAVVDNANSVGAAMDTDTKSLNVVPFAVASSPNFNDAWDITGVLPNSVTNSGLVPVQTWMGFQLDGDLVNDDSASVNVFGRLKTALGIYCAVGVGAGLSGVTITDGYPADGAFSVTFTQSMINIIANQCDMDVADMLGEELTVTVAAATGDYDKRFSFDDFGQVYFVRADENEINIATAEIGDQGSPSRTLVSWNLSTDVMLVEHVALKGAATGPVGTYGYRLYYDGANDIGQLMVHEGTDQNANESTRYILAAKPETGDGFSLSMSAQGLSSNALFEACVSPEGDILTSGARCTASSTRLAGADVTAAADGVFDDLFTQVADASYGTVDTNTGFVWSNTTNMLSTNFAP